MSPSTAMSDAGEKAGARTAIVATDLTKCFGEGETKVTAVEKIGSGRVWRSHTVTA